MQLLVCQQQLQLARPAAHAPTLVARRKAKQFFQPRLSNVVVKYQSYDEAGPSTSEVTAEDTYRAAALNMPQGAWAGRWERWAPPADGLPGSASVADETRGWQLLTSGQTAYTVKASGSSTSVSTVDAPDSPPLSLAQASAQAATAAVLGADQQGGMQASLRSGPMSGSNVLRADHSFSKDDHLFRPYLPDRTQPGGDSGLRLWAADGLGFVLAPTALPLSTLHTQPLGGSAGAAGAAGSKEVPPFVVYIKHPSHQPGVGRRWGWNLAFLASPAAAGSAGALQYIHHTSLGPVDSRQSGGGPEALLGPGPHTRPPTAPRPLPPSLASFMAAEGHHWLRMNGSAVDFTYDSGRLTRTDTGSISWHGSPSGSSSSSLEVWYSSGSYTRSPVSLQAQLLSGGPVVLEAGALIYRDASLSAPVDGVARWFLSYRSGDGALDAVRLEVYRTAAD